jgi:hypothetical protein
MRDFRCKVHPRYEGKRKPKAHCLVCTLIYWLKDADHFGNKEAEELFSPWMKFTESKPYKE